jgi:hypothetical protein
MRSIIAKKYSHLLMLHLHFIYNIHFEYTKLIIILNTAYITFTYLTYILKKRTCEYNSLILNITSDKHT